MVRDTGIPMSTYQRIERGDYERPPLQALMNCAIVLDVELKELLEDRFTEWTVFRPAAASTPEPPSWRRRRTS